MMIIDITKIKSRPGARMDFQLSGLPEIPVGEQNEFRLIKPVQITGHLVYQDDFFVDYHFTATVEQICSRCGQPFSRDVEGDAQARFTVSAAEDSAGEDNIFSLMGDQVDLTAAVLNEIYLLLPMQPLCSDDCRGLCPVCGTDLNHNSCSCIQKQIDPRWEKLKNLIT